MVQKRTLYKKSQSGHQNHNLQCIYQSITDYLIKIYYYRHARLLTCFQNYLKFACYIHCRTPFCCYIHMLESACGAHNHATPTLAMSHNLDWTCTILHNSQVATLIIKVIKLVSYSDQQLQYMSLSPLVFSSSMSMLYHNWPLLYEGHGYQLTPQLRTVDKIFGLSGVCFRGIPMYFENSKRRNQPQRWEFL